MQYYGTPTTLAADQDDNQTCCGTWSIVELIAFILIPPLLLKMWRSRSSGAPVTAHLDSAAADQPSAAARRRRAAPTPVASPVAPRRAPRRGPATRPPAPPAVGCARTGVGGVACCRGWRCSSWLFLLVLSPLQQSRAQDVLYTQFRSELAAATAPFGVDPIPPGDPVALLEVAVGRGQPGRGRGHRRR